MVTEYNVFLSFGSSQLQQLLRSMSTLDTVVGGSFPVEARLLETDRFAVGSCDVVVVLVILTTFTVIAAV